jgi:hypothetical protein
MNKQEATKLLALIKVAYPTAYRDMDDASKKATVNMWQMSFPDVPYPIMEQAFNHFRMVSKFPPTVAEMVEELRHIHYQALEQANMQQLMGDREAMKQCMAVMSVTAKYKDTYYLGGLDMTRLQGMIGGESDVQRLGASRDYLCAENRVSELDAGR